MSFQNSCECEQCGFSHTGDPVAICCDCGIFLYNDHDCSPVLSYRKKGKTLEPIYDLKNCCSTWNCSKRRDQLKYHKNGYMLLKVFPDDSEERDIFCPAPHRFFIKNNKEEYWKKMNKVMELNPELYKNKNIDKKKQKKKLNKKKNELKEKEEDEEGETYELDIGDEQNNDDDEEQVDPNEFCDNDGDIEEFDDIIEEEYEDDYN